MQSDLMCHKAEISNNLQRQGLKELASIKQDEMKPRTLQGGEVRIALAEQ